jgi:DUF1680 family protein
MTRRTFFSGAAAAAAGAPLLRNLDPSPFQARPGQPAEPARLRVRPFDLKRVRLRRGVFLDAAEVNRRYMMSLEPDSLLHMFRITAGLPSSAKPLGGWEQPENELRGHFTGHYLSACALVYSATGDESFKTRGEKLVAELGRCQKALGNGYLSAFPETFFDRLRAGTNVWAPFYTLHKIMAGLLDMNRHCGSQQALDMLKGMAEWTRRWADPLGASHMARVLEREYGGINDILYDLFSVTGERGHRTLAAKFDHERIFAPLAEGRDELKGLHVNTQIPKIIGAARRYEVIGDARYRDIAEYFWREVTGRRSYCTGGTSNGEGWNAEPGKLAGELSGYTQECCCTYNMLKLTRQLFTWTADPRCADYYERALLNGILGTQHPSDGMTLYYVALASGYWKMFGLPLDAFWCCTGTGIESFAKLADSIYFHDEDGVYVNLFIASEVEWTEKGIKIVQDTAFPESDTTTLAIRSEKPVKMALRIRVPYWTARGGGVTLNGRPLESFAEPGSYFVLNRTWQDGDKVDVKLPMNLHVHAMPDDSSVLAAMYGPLVLAGRLGKEGLTAENIRAEPTGLRQVPRYRSNPVAPPEFKTKSQEPRDWIEPVQTGALEFRTTGQARDVTMVPFYKILDERYAVYWKVTQSK